jgi:hypothetical protein
VSSLRRRLTRDLRLLATLPVLLLAILVGLAELLLGTDGTAAQWLAGPFLRAVDRRRGRG